MISMPHDTAAWEAACRTASLDRFTERMETLGYRPTYSPGPWLRMFAFVHEMRGVASRTREVTVSFDQNTGEPLRWVLDNWMLPEFGGCHRAGTFTEDVNSNPYDLEHPAATEEAFFTMVAFL